MDMEQWYSMVDLPVQLYMYFRTLGPTAVQSLKQPGASGRIGAHRGASGRIGAQRGAAGYSWILRVQLYLTYIYSCR